MNRNNEKYKIGIEVILVAVVCLLTYYFHIIIKADIIFTHTFYIPIVLASFWWKRKGVFVAIFLGVILIMSSFFYKSGLSFYNDYFRAPMFIAVAIVVAILSEQIEKKEEEIKMINQSLERRVEERTIQLENVNKGLKTFSYAVSHDLRAPLRAIDGFSKILLEEHSDQLNAEAKRVLNIVCDNTKNMGMLMDDLLRFFRISEDEIKMVNVDIKNLAEKVFKELMSVTPGRDIELKMKTLPSVFADKSMVYHVFSNLLSNAIKFTGNREKAVIEIGGQEEKNENLYYVKDNGVGFDMKYADKLFGVFQRLHTQEEFQGTGIGLAIAQRIIYRHGGRIWGEGKVNQGATFYFTLPKKHKEDKNES